MITKDISDWGIKQKILGKNYKLLKSYSIDFFQTFKTPLYKYIDAFGFNIIAFDENMVESYDLDGASCLDIVQEKYGNKGVKLIENLLNVN